MVGREQVLLGEVRTEKARKEALEKEVAELKAELSRMTTSVNKDFEKLEESHAKTIRDKDREIRSLKSDRDSLF